MSAVLTSILVIAVIIVAAAIVVRREAKNKKLILAEVALIVVSVFVFRGLWLLLDEIAFMNSMPALWISLVIGIAASIPVLHYIIKNS